MTKYFNFNKFKIKINLINKKINLILNKLLKKNLNKFNSKKLLNLVKSNKFYRAFVLIVILFLSYLSIPNIYDKNKISKEIETQLKNKFSLDFNLSENLKYSFLPRPHFTYIDSIISQNQNEISKNNKLKIYISLNNFFNFKNVKFKNFILENSNLDLNNQTYNFFTKILHQNFDKSTFIIKKSNVFYKNKNNEVLFINKIKNLKYYYESKNLQNVAISENEIFNLPYALDFQNKKTEKKLSSKFILNFLKLKIENELNYTSTKKGKMYLGWGESESFIKYQLNNNDLIFSLSDKLDSSNFAFEGKVNLNPFYSNFKGTTKKLNLSHILNGNSLVSEFIKTEILNNKNLNFDLNIYADKVKNFQSFVNFLLKSKIKNGLIDIDETNISWKNNTVFKITNSLLYVKKGELILDGKLDVDIKRPQEIYKFLQAPKKLRTKIKNIELNFIYNFDQKILTLNEITIDNNINLSVNKILKNLIFNNGKLQNKVYLKSKFNSALRAYSG